MNIFTLSTDPVTSAELMCDQHINKMLLESTQLLCTAVSLLYKQIGGSPPATSLYRPTHQSHPCMFWLLGSKANCDWLYKHTDALERERQVRFDKWTPHQSKLIAAQAHFCLSHPSLAPRWRQAPLTAPTQAMPLQLQQLDEPPTFEQSVQAYRDYYNFKNDCWIADGKKPMTWTNRERPDFMVKEQTL